MAEQYSKVMHYFKEISKIPRGSGNTEKIADYCENFAISKGLSYIRDEADNVVIFKKGTKNLICLQGHTDMVCEAEEGVCKDFLNEGIEIIEENGWLRANKTTLGADNGAAVAIMLSLLEENSEDFPSIEAVFTSNEEIGLLGASKLDKSILKSDMFINIDGEDEGVIIAGCAGGRRETLFLPVQKEKINGYEYTLSASGLSGGHSGVEIDRGGANAIKLLGKLLRAVYDKESSFLADIKGGGRDNVIPASIEAVLVFKNDKEDFLMKTCEKYSKLFSKQYGETDPNIKVTVKANGTCTRDAYDFKKLSEIICEVPNGVMERDENGFVITSLNLGVLESGEGFVKLGFGVRSSIDAKKEALCERLKKIAEKYGAKAEESGDYTGWEFKKESKLRDILSREYSKLTGKDAEITVIHAGLECGVFSKGKEKFDAVSIGPDMLDIHTPRERMNIDSFKRTYELVKNVCKALK